MVRLEKFSINKKNIFLMLLELRKKRDTLERMSELKLINCNKIE